MKDVVIVDIAFKKLYNIPKVISAAFNIVVSLIPEPRLAQQHAIRCDAAFPKSERKRTRLSCGARKRV